MFNFIFRHRLHHAIYWTVMLIAWVFYSMVFYHRPFVPALISTVIWLLTQAALCYTVIYWLMPVFFNNRRYGLFALLTFVSMALWSAVNAAFVLWYLWMLKPSAPLFPFGSLFIFTLMTNFYACFVFIAAKAIRDRLMEERHKRMVEKATIENELRFLRSQLNPHFLFNAINSIYVLIRKDADTAAATLARFADMLRYQLYECNTIAIPIEKEIDYLNNYIQLERLRKDNHLHLDYHVTDTVRNFSIAPLLLMPFVENAFKYVSAGAKAVLSIQLDYRSGTFEMIIENTVDEMPAIERPAGVGGIGLENVRRRLELIYPKQHELLITPAPGYFTVQLRITPDGNRQQASPVHP